MTHLLTIFMVLTGVVSCVGSAYAMLPGRARVRAR